MYLFSIFLINGNFDLQAYTSKHLKGLTIGHDVDSFKEGTPVILTLKDKGMCIYILYFKNCTLMFLHVYFLFI